MSRSVETLLRVRYAETDQMGVVYYSNYLVWMEIGRTDFCLHSGFRYRDMESEDGVMIAVAEARCRYHRPARYDDRILVRTSLASLKRRMLTFAYDIRNADTGEQLATGSTVHVALGVDGSRRSIPPRQFDLLATRAGAPSE